MQLLRAGIGPDVGEVIECDGVVQGGEDFEDCSRKTSIGGFGEFYMLCFCRQCSELVDKLSGVCDHADPFFGVIVDSHEISVK